jgi:hypothetical protein
MRARFLGLGLVMGFMAVGGLRAAAQASAIPSAQSGLGSQGASTESAKGRKLLDQMVTALGGTAWLGREDMLLEGRSATFYKGAPHEGAPAYEEYYRFHPFAERVVTISHFGVFIATDHRDEAVVWHDDGGWEVTYKGKKDLPVKEVDDFKRRHAHTLEVLVNDWLKQPGVLVTYEGSNMVERRLAEQVSVLTSANDAMTLELDETTHLPLSLSFQWRDPLYKDFNTDVEEYDDYHEVQGIQTPYAVTLLHNGDMVGQRFLTKVQYNTKLVAALFDPDVRPEKKNK